MDGQAGDQRNFEAGFATARGDRGEPDPARLAGAVGTARRPGVGAAVSRVANDRCVFHHNVLFRITMPNAKSAATGSITVQKRTTSISRKLLIKIAFISVGAYLG